ncbi:iron-sulfur cluster co-chaperone protein HscB [Anas acuta]|uniref:iron-sulfur cluster co-chaperone protein HscB n=1 Tax=Anas platyrhynchos TaxID=8839 RepID=UPI0018D5BF6F|nr:iron-sulfur cluster co-chaperone protein HscB [Anas platyrhynchos]
MDCLDVQRLQRRFRSLQRALHPDRFGQRPPFPRNLEEASAHGLVVEDDEKKEQHYSEQHSSLVNKAYQTLLNPLSRGLYLLELNGVEPAQETDCDADSEFLTEIMEINEKLAESKNEDSLEETETLIKVKREELTKEVTAAFERDDLQEAKKLLAKMKYFANLEDKLKNKKMPS